MPGPPRRRGTPASSGYARRSTYPAQLPVVLQTLAVARAHRHDRPRRPPSPSEKPIALLETPSSLLRRLALPRRHRRLSTHPPGSRRCHKDIFSRPTPSPSCMRPRRVLCAIPTELQPRLLSTPAKFVAPKRLIRCSRPEPASEKRAPRGRARTGRSERRGPRSKTTARVMQSGARPHQRR